MKVGTSLSLISTFYTAYFGDVQKHLPENKAISLDLAYLQKRMANEGKGFATRLLPLLGKAVETSLITLSPFQCPMGFELVRESRLPKFLNSLLKSLFDNQGNCLYDIRDLRHERARAAAYPFWVIRQVCLAFSKVEDCGCLEDEEQAMKKFMDRMVEKPTITCDSRILLRARRLLSWVLCEDENLNAMLAQWESNPFGRHGPGATFEGDAPCEKWNFKRVPGVSPSLYSWSGTSVPKDFTSGYARVCCVPKDFKSLRTICIESKEQQFAQQGLLSVLMDIVHTNRLTRKAISFVDQGKSGLLAKDYRYATIDLKDASDRVSKTLCRLLFSREVFSVLSRHSSRALYHNGKAHRVEPFATMGSAICFPVETLVFWSITRATLESMGIAPHLRVFGDDIICPLQGFDAVIDSLQRCGFVINTSKTCRDSLIRESCGAYYWCGYDVRIVRFKRTTCESFEAWQGLLKYAQSFWDCGFMETAKAIGTIANEWWPLNKAINHRYSKTLQRSEVKIPVACVRRVGRALPGHTGMYAWIVGNDTHPSYRGTVKVKSKWVQNEGYSFI